MHLSFIDTQIVGHELSKGRITDKYTYGGASLKRLKEVVNAFYVSLNCMCLHIQ